MRTLWKKAACAAICLGMLLVLPGCGGLEGIVGSLLGDFDAQLYVRGTLDAMYLNKYDQDFLDIVDGTSQEMDSQYEDGIQGEYTFLTDQFHIEDDNITDATREEIKQLLRDIYTHSKYEVAEANKNGDEFSVKVTVHPITIFYDVMEEDYDAFANHFDSLYADMSNEQLGAMSEDEQAEFWNEYEETWARGIVDLIKARMANITFADPVIELVRIYVEDDMYSVSDEDWSDLDWLILKYY